jgi:hypothetical protein
MDKLNDAMAAMVGESAYSENAGETKNSDEDCAFCDLFLTEAEQGKAGKKDAELFSAHLASGDHEHVFDEIKKAQADLDYL